MRYRLTEEQLAAVEHFRSGESLKIEALAGTGKTSTLVAMAEAAKERSGHYFAFNKSIADEAKGRFPNSVATSTVHSLAYRYVRQAFTFSEQKLLQNPSINQVSHLLAMRPKGDFRLFDRVDLNGRELSSVLYRACKNFLASPDDEPMPRHFSPVGKLAKASNSELTNFAVTYLPNVKEIWRSMQDPNSAFPLGHDGYLKLWALARPRLARDYILLDEAQDTSDVVLDVLANQDCQVVYVGDEHQQIYEWRGAVNAMNKTESVRKATLTLSFRFGQKIADAANLVLKELGCKELIRGNPNVASTVGPHSTQTVLCRGNVDVIETVVQHLDQSRRCFVVGGIKDIIALLQEVSVLKSGIPSRHPEFFGFEDWHDVLSYCEEDPMSHLRVLVRLVKRFGEQQLIAILKRTATDDFDAQIVVSTAHKAKGREWSKVEVHSGFDAIFSKKVPKNEFGEIRLFYVAMTRAKHNLLLPPDARGYYGISQEMELPPQRAQAPRLSI